MTDKDVIVTAMKGVEDEMSVPPNVYLPPNIRGKKTKAIALHAPVSVHDNIVKITNDGDPLAMLIALLNGQPVPTYIVDGDGECKTIYETPTLAQRISIGKWLGDRVMPKVNVSVKKDLDDDWESNLRNAAVRTGDEGV